MTTPATPERVGTARVPTVRNANYQDLLAMLQEQQARTIDVVVNVNQIRFADGMLHVFDVDPEPDEDGVTDANGTYWPTQVFDDQLADRLGITTAYLRRLRHGVADRRGKATAVPRLDLWDANVNGLLHGRKRKVSYQAFREPGQSDPPITVLREAVPPDPRLFFLRLLWSDDEIGIARAILSDRFARMDNVDGLTAMLAGIRDAGIDPQTLRIYGDLSETRMFVHVAAPQILAAAPGLLDGYRSQFDNESERGKRSGHALSVAERIELGRQFRETGRDVGHSGF